MVKSKRNILANLDNGGHIAVGMSSGYWLVDKDGDKQRVHGRVVLELIADKSIARSDNHSSANGATWGLYDKNNDDWNVRTDDMVC